MKKIKCGSCTGTWIVEDSDLERQRVCPYCIASIRGEIEFSEYDSLDKAIYGAISKMGKDILQNPRQLVGFLMDTAPGLKKEIRIFSKTVNEDYVVDIRHAFEQEPDAAEITINNKLRHLFVEEEGLSDRWADMICKGLYGAVLFSKGIGTSRLINVEIVDFEANNHSETGKCGNVRKKEKSIIVQTKNKESDRHDKEFFLNIRSQLEKQNFLITLNPDEDKQKTDVQNCFAIFMNNYYLLEKGVVQSKFRWQTGLLYAHVCPFLLQFDLVVKEHDNFYGYIYKVSDLGTEFYHTFA